MSNAKKRCAFRGCRQYFDSAIGISNGVNSWCSDKCQYEHAMDNARKVRLQRMGQEIKERKAQRKGSNKLKAELRAKDLPRQLAATQVIANKLCSMLDAGKPCISCGRQDEGGRKRNAGHHKSRGANSGLRFDLLNLHGQCQQCNMHKSGNLVEYQNGLRARYGQWILDYLDSAPRLKAWTLDELAAIREQYRAEIAHIKKHGQPSKDWRSNLEK